MEQIVFEVPGTPTGKARARTFYSQASKKIRSITPKETASYENLVKLCFLQYRPAGFSIIQDPVRVKILSHFRKAKSNRMIMPMVKPDADNICKIILDSLNGIAYLDDKQVIDVHVKKVWSSTAEEKTTVIIEKA